MLLATLLTMGAVLSGPALAASCWRDTPCTGPSSAAFPGSWDTYIASPWTRTVSPTKILHADGTLLATYPSSASLASDGAQAIYDFWLEVGGIVTVSYSVAGSGTGKMGLAFSESNEFVGENSDSSNGNFGRDGALFTEVSSTNGSIVQYTMPDEKLRGGFRYLTLFAQGSGFNITITKVTCELSYAPTWSNLRAYQGYFYSSDDLLNRIWYAGAYTLQTNSVPPNTGRILDGDGGSGWDNNAELNVGTNGSVIYVDGSKRDRTVWSGDMAVAVPSLLVSTGDTEGLANTLQTLLNLQLSTGQLPFAGPPLDIYGSDTYHMAVLLGFYEYFRYTGDNAFANNNWAKYQLALNFIIAKIDDSGLLNVTGGMDWGRDLANPVFGQSTEPNMLMYRVLTTAVALTNWLGKGSSQTLSTQASKLRAAVNNLAYDTTAGAFQDNTASNSLHPQDGNSLALYFGVANSANTQSISSYLTKNWNAIGSVSPELPGNIVGFSSSFEVKAHFAARQATRALSLIRRSWGWYLNNPAGTQSTIIEGYLSDGTFGYRYPQYGYGDVSYTSHAHGWSTGPTDALSSYVVGIQLTGPGGSSVTLAPQFGDLAHVEGGFVTPRGKFSASWYTIPGGFTLLYNFPPGTAVQLVLPAEGKAPRVVGASGSVAGAVLSSSSSPRGVYAGPAGAEGGGTYTLTGQASSASLNVTY